MPRRSGERRFCTTSALGQRRPEAVLSVPIRLLPGQDIRRALEAALAERGLTAGFVIAGIGSLSRTPLRMAGRPDPTELTGDQELLTLSGSVSPVGSHLHATVSNADGEVSGGHLAYGSVVRTTAEVLLALLPEWSFSRAHDPGTGYDELKISSVTR